MISEKDNLRSTMIRGIVLIFSLNALLIFIYCLFFFNISVKEETKIAKSDISGAIPKIENDLTLDNAAYLSNKYDVSISLKNTNNEYIFNNTTDSNFKTYSDKIITINNTYYLLTVTKELDFNINILITRILYLELFIILLITIISYNIISRKILIPIGNLRKDMIGYQNGILPSKRDDHSSITELQNNFIDLTNALELEKDKQNQIIASISHDIKTPLTSIMGYAKRLETASLTDEKKKEYIHKINSKSLVMRDIISEFDDYLGCNLTKTLNFKKILIRDLVSIIKDDFEDELENDNVKLKIKNKTNKTDYIIADETKIKRIFNNLISNSKRYLDKPKKFITIIISNDEGKIKFEVIDNGKMLDNDKLDRIFDPLYTTDKSRKISGLGLAIVKQIVRIHKGNIYAENNKYGGLSIIFTIGINEERRG